MRLEKEKAISKDQEFPCGIECSFACMFQYMSNSVSFNMAVNIWVKQIFVCMDCNLYLSNVYLLCVYILSCVINEAKITSMEGIP